MTHIAIHSHIAIAIEAVVPPKVHLEKITKSITSEVALLAAVPGSVAFRLDVECVPSYIQFKKILNYS